MCRFACALFLVLGLVAVPAFSQETEKEVAPSPAADHAGGKKKKRAKPGRGKVENPAVENENSRNVMDEQTEAMNKRNEEEAEAFLKNFAREGKEQELAIQKFEKAVNEVDPEKLWQLVVAKYEAIIPRMEALKTSVEGEDLSDLIPIQEALGFQLHQMTDGGYGKSFRTIKKATDADRKKILANNKAWLFEMLAKMEVLEDSSSFGEKYLAKFKKLDEPTRKAVVASAGKEFVELVRSVGEDMRKEAAKPGENSIYHAKHGALDANPLIWGNPVPKALVLRKHRDLMAGQSDAQIAQESPKWPKEKYESYRTGASAAESFEMLWGLTGRKVEQFPEGLVEISDKFF